MRIACARSSNRFLLISSTHLEAPIDQPYWSMKTVEGGFGSNCIFKSVIFPKAMVPICSSVAGFKTGIILSRLINPLTSDVKFWKIFHLILFHFIPGILFILLINWRARQMVDVIADCFLSMQRQLPTYSDECTLRLGIRDFSFTCVTIIT